MPAGTHKRAPRSTKPSDIEPPLPDHGPDTVGNVLEDAHPKARACKRTTNNKQSQEDPNNGTGSAAPPELPTPPPPPKPDSKPARKGRKAKAPDMEPPLPRHGSNAVGEVSANVQSTTEATKRTSDKKRSREGLDSSVETPPAKKSCETASPPPQHNVELPKGRSPLPHHDGRNEHPGVRVAGKKRCTPEEVAAEKAAKEEKKCWLVELEAEKRKLLRQMELEEEEQDLEHEINTVRRLSDVRFFKSGGYKSESEGEVFDMDVSSTEPEDIEMTAADGKRKPTATKAGRTAAAAAAMKKPKTKSVVGERKKTATRKGDKAVVASGLIPDWKKHTKATQKSLDNSKPGVGGLTDADAQATKPDFGEPTEFWQNKTIHFDNTCDLSRRNADVAPVSSKPEFETEEKKSVLKRSGPVRRAPKHEQSQARQPLQNIPHKPQPSHALTGNRVQVSHLPKFTDVDSKWRKVFIPSLYNTFFHSSTPFKDFALGSTTFILIVQDVLNRVYPEVEYAMTKNDTICLLAYNRISEKRSSLGSDAIEYIRTSVKNRGEDIIAWCRWAKRVDGPLFYSKPTPKSSPINLTHEGYIKPEGHLQSAFIIKLATDYLRLANGAVDQGGRPVGLFALILTALEQAVCGYVKGVWTAPKDFSDKFFGDCVLEYAASCLKVKERNWEEILDACGVSAHDPNDSSSENEMADISLLDRQRGMLFDFSSPVKI